MHDVVFPDVKIKINPIHYRIELMPVLGTALAVKIILKITLLIILLFTLLFP